MNIYCSTLYSYTTCNQEHFYSHTESYRKHTPVQPRTLLLTYRKLQKTHTCATKNTSTQKQKVIRIHSIAAKNTFTFTKEQKVIRTHTPATKNTPTQQEKVIRTHTPATPKNTSTHQQKVIRTHTPATKNTPSHQQKVIRTHLPATKNIYSLTETYRKHTSVQPRKLLLPTYWKTQMLAEWSIEARTLKDLPIRWLPALLLNKW